MNVGAVNERASVRVIEWASEQTKQNKTQNNEKETGKFARPNECNNKITLSQISFLFVVFWYADKIASASPLCFCYSTDESFIQFLSTERIEPKRERVLSHQNATQFAHISTE